MIDGLKLRIQGPAMERVRNHPLLTFVETDRTGVFVATWGAYTVTGNERIAWHITGSPHCDYFGGENWQDFNRAMFGAAVDHLCGSLGLHDAQLLIEGLEHGVNVTPTEETALILDSVKSHRRSIARRMCGPDAIGLVIAHGKGGRNYRWKIYDKAHQYRLARRLVRVELAHRQTAAIRALGIRTLADLRTEKAWSDLAALLRTKFDELHIVEPYTDTSALRPAQVAIVEQAMHPAKWVAMPNAQRCRKAKALERIYAQHASPRIRPGLRELIHAKLIELNTPSDALPVIDPPGVAAPLPVTTSPGGQVVLPVTDSPLMINGHFVTGNVAVFGVCVEGVGKAQNVVPAILPGPPCKTCGLPTGSTRKGSRFCSAKVYGEQAAKACRNADSNPRNNHKRAIERAHAGGTLFDQRPFIRPLGPLQEPNASAR